MLVVPAADSPPRATRLIMDRETQAVRVHGELRRCIDIEEVLPRPRRRSLRLPVDPTLWPPPAPGAHLALALYSDFNQVKAAARMMEPCTTVFTGNVAPSPRSTPSQPLRAAIARTRCQDVIADTSLFWRPDLVPARAIPRKSRAKRPPAGQPFVHQARGQRRLCGEMSPVAMATMRIW